MTRVLGIAAGVLNHLLFGVTVVYLYGFLAGWTGPARPLSLSAIGIDALLCLQFAVSHSWLLLPKTRERIALVIAKPFYGTLFCTATCVSLLLTIACWQPIDLVLIEFDGWARTLMQAAFILTWPTLLYSINLTGLGHQTGLTSWWSWVKGQKPAFRSFTPRSLYCWFRHPIYASFLGLLWFSPRVTLDRALLIGLWSIYIAIGSVLKDQRLVHYLGDSYRRYQSQVSGYPGLWFSPLGKVPLHADKERVAPIAHESGSSLRRAA